VREGACIGAATILQPWTLRLNLNAAALAAASPIRWVRDTRVCVCLLLQDLVQSCLRGGGRYGRTCATRDDEPRPVWTCVCLLGGSDAESRRGRRSVDDTLVLAARAVGPARHLGRLALILSPKGDAQREGAINFAARGCGWRCGCAGPTGRLSLHRLLLVATIVLFLFCFPARLRGGLEIRIGGIWTRRKFFAAPVLTFGTDVNLPLTLTYVP
jgi:hypothetical protein